MSPETGDLGGGLEAAELLMGLRHGGRGGGVDTGAVTVTGVGWGGPGSGNPSTLAGPAGSEPPASERPASPAHVATGA